MPVCLTISHCEEWALCAVIALDSRQATSGPAASAGQAPPAIGVDIGHRFHAALRHHTRHDARPALTSAGAAEVFAKPLRLRDVTPRIVELAATAAAAEIMPGWWTTRDGFVLTLAFSQNMA